jgi:hypothetical protein
MIYFKDLGLSAVLPDAFNTGLGNQFFQIATTVGVASNNNDIAIFPKWKYNEFFEGIDTDDVSNFRITDTYFESAPWFHFQEIPYKDGMNLSGYFQSEKYFLHCKDKIKKIFTLKESIKKSLIDKWGDRLNNSLSIHVRRGDYLQKQYYHPCPTMDYFNSGINYIKERAKIENILVFSDDISWCKQNFKDVIFIENQTDYEDISLMSYCNHHVITNSSFSWWSSWLNDYEDKIIIAPKIWFGQHVIWNDMYQEKMIII